jgi:hypothetical protein
MRFFVHFMSEQIPLFDLELKFCSDLILKRKLIITLCFDSISKRIIAFYSSCAVRRRKIKQQRLIFQFSLGKKELIIGFSMIESKKQIAFIKR